ncbi:hypothetical protein NORO109296_26235 [Nocardiopsis rhodophaea]
MNDLYDGLDFPRTQTALAALRFAKRVEHPAVFNHNMRTYLSGRFAGEQDGVLPGRDDEALFLGCVLHDVGLSAEGDGDQTFIVGGADLAARFLTELGLGDDTVETAWDAGALHLRFEIARRKRPEVALVTTGAGYELGIHPRHPLPDGYPGAPR